MTTMEEAANALDTALRRIELRNDTHGGTEAIAELVADGYGLRRGPDGTVTIDIEPKSGTSRLTATWCPGLPDEVFIGTASKGQDETIRATARTRQQFETISSTRRWTNANRLELTLAQLRELSMQMRTLQWFAEGLSQSRAQSRQAIQRIANDAAAIGIEITIEECGDNENPISGISLLSYRISSADYRSRIHHKDANDGTTTWTIGGQATPLAIGIVHDRTTKLQTGPGVKLAIACLDAHLQRYNKRAWNTDQWHERLIRIRDLKMWRYLDQAEHPYSRRLDLRRTAAHAGS